MKFLVKLLSFIALTILAVFLLGLGALITVWGMITAVFVIVGASAAVIFGFPWLWVVTYIKELQVGLSKTTAQQIKLYKEKV